MHLQVNISHYTPISGSTWIDLNVKNKDDSCFLRTATAGLHPFDHGRHLERVTLYPQFSDVLKYDDIHFPIPMKDIHKFEELNNLQINVFRLASIGKSEVAPMALSKNNYERTVNLLLVHSGGGEEEFDEEKEEEGERFDEERMNMNILKQIRAPKQFHYMWINNLSRLLRKQLTSSGKHT